MHSSQQHHQLPHHHRSNHHHQHSNSGPHGHQRRDRSNRLDPEDTRGYISQPPMAQHRSPNHNPVHSHSSPKRSSRYLPPTHGEARVGPPREPFQSSPHMYQSRRRSSEESPDLRKLADPNPEKRRVSADGIKKQDPRMCGSNGVQSLPPSKARSVAKTKADCKFVETINPEDLEAGCSQQWEDSAVVNPADIVITLENEDGVKSKSTSSGSTLIESDSSPSEARKIGKKQDLSQEPFGDEDHKDMMSLVPGPVPIPLSNFPHYYEPPGYFGDDQQEGYPSSSSGKHEQAIHGQSLSQSTYPSPPKSRYGKSLTDLTGSNVSLTSSQQLLSQSAADFRHMHDLHRYPDSSRQMSESRRKHEHRFQAPRSQLQRMSSDSHLNKSHIPGLQLSIISALSDVTEEQEQRRQAREKRALSRAASQQPPHTVQHRTPQKSSQLQQKHLKATMVRGNGEGNKQTTSPHR